MAVKIDASGKRRVEMELVLKSTLEAVWQAVATGKGNSAWFTETELEEKQGGSLRFQFGADGSSAGEILEWSPPTRFAYVEREWMPNAPAVVTEITLSPRPGEECLMRMVHWVETDSTEWDHHLEGFETGWAFFFEVLKIYLTHFSGKAAASMRVSRDCTGQELESWKSIAGSLGLGGKHVGEQVTSSDPALSWSGVLERIHEDSKGRDYIVRLSQPGEGVVGLGSYAWDGQTRAMGSFYFYGDNAKELAARLQGEWDAWFERIVNAKPASA